jgi:hypothetical protein
MPAVPVDVMLRAVRKAGRFLTEKPEGRERGTHAQDLVVDIRPVIIPEDEGNHVAIDDMRRAGAVTAGEARDKAAYRSPGHEGLSLRAKRSNLVVETGLPRTLRVLAMTARTCAWQNYRRILTGRRGSGADVGRSPSHPSRELRAASNAEAGLPHAHPRGGSSSPFGKGGPRGICRYIYHRRKNRARIISGRRGGRVLRGRRSYQGGRTIQFPQSPTSSPEIIPYGA